MITEAQIKEALDGRFYSLTFSEFGKVAVVDMNSAGPDEAARYNPWTDEELRTLVVLKRGRRAVAEISQRLHRSEDAVRLKWACRAEWMGRAFVPNARNPLLADIAEVVCSVCGVGKNEFVSNRRTAKVVEARQVYYWLAKYCTSQSFPQVGKAAGGKDHSTVLHGVKKVDEKYEQFREKIEVCLFDLGIGNPRMAEAA